jgi:hypothetical protein
MFSLATLTAVCVLGAVTVSATPVARQAPTCSPNFEGAAVSIIANQVEWDVSPVVAGTPLKKDVTGTFPLNATAEWHVEQTGAANPTTYIVKYVGFPGPMFNLTDRVVYVGHSPPPTTSLWTSLMGY